MINRKNHRTPVALVLALALLGVGGVSIAAASSVPSLVRQDVVVRTNPPTNLTPDDPGAMPVDTPTDIPTGTTSAEPTTGEPTGTPPVATDTPDPLPVETTSVSVTPTRNPVRATDEADPVDPLPPGPVVEETTFNPVQPTTETSTPTS